MFPYFAFCAGSLTSGAYQASPQHQQAGWQQDRQAEAEMGSAPSGGGGDPGGKGSADNIFYAIVALLPELGLKHLQWARDEVCGCRDCVSTDVKNLIRM